MSVLKRFPSTLHKGRGLALTQNLGQRKSTYFFAANVKKIILFGVAGARDGATSNSPIKC